MSMELDRLDLAMKVQATLQRKSLDQQAAGVLKLVASVTEGQPARRSAPEPGKGARVDRRA